MIEVREATESEASSWVDGWADRLRVRYAAVDAPPAWAGDQVRRALSAWHGAARARVHTLSVEGGPVGILATSPEPRGGTQVCVVVDLWIAPEHRLRGYATQALAWAAEHAGPRTTALWATIDPADVAHRGLFHKFPLRSQLMIKSISSPEPVPNGVVAGPMTAEEFTTWRADMIRSYADDIAGSGSLSPEAAEARANEQTNQLIPMGLATPDHTFWSLRVGSDVAATNWLCHHQEPGVSFVYGVDADDKFRGRGYGRAAMLIGEQATLDAGDTHLALNVFGHNVVAMSLYRGMEYQVVEQYRALDL